MKLTWREMLAAVVILGTAATARAAGPVAGAPRATVNFGHALQYDEGVDPAVAMNDNGLVVEVHKSQGASTLWYHVGNASVFDVDWGPSSKYDEGVNPSVALTKDGIVIEVHESQSLTTLWYHVGRVNGREIKWGPSRKYDDGQQPSVAINAQGQIVEVHKSQGLVPTLWYHVGTLEGDTIKWGGSHKYDEGDSPSVSLNDRGQVLEVHKSQSASTLWYHVGTLHGEEISFGSSHKYDDGVSPAVSLGNDGMAVEVHQSQNLITLWQRTGMLESSGEVAWTGAVEFDTGASPSVAHNSSQLAIQVHGTSTPLRFGLWSSTCLIADRSRWMEQTPGVAAKPLWQVTIPGTHDSGTYSLSTDRCPCRDLKFNIPKINVVGEFTRPFSEAQGTDIAGQLAGGARFFDVRPYDDGHSYRAFHDVIGPDISTMLDQVRAFLASVNKELVILDISHFCSPGGNGDKFRHADFQALLQQKLGPYLSDVSADRIMTTPIGEIVASRPRVLLLYEDDSAKNKPGFYMTSQMKVINPFANTDDYGKMVAYETEQLKLGQNQASPTQLFLLSWTLTFEGASDIKYGSLHGIADQANPSMGRFLSQNRQYKINILYNDFFADARSTDLSIMLNR